MLSYLPRNDLTNVDNTCGNIVDKNDSERLDFPCQVNYIRFTILQKMVLRCAVKMAHDFEIIKNACILAK